MFVKMNVRRGGPSQPEILPSQIQQLLSTAGPSGIEHKKLPRTTMSDQASACAQTAAALIVADATVFANLG